MNSCRTTEFIVNHRNKSSPPEKDYQRLSTVWARLAQYIYILRISRDLRPAETQKQRSPSHPNTHLIELQVQLTCSSSSYIFGVDAVADVIDTTAVANVRTFTQRSPFYKPLVIAVTNRDALLVITWFGCYGCRLTRAEHFFAETFCVLKKNVERRISVASFDVGFLQLSDTNSSLSSVWTFKQQRRFTSAALTHFSHHACFRFYARPTAHNHYFITIY